MLMPGIEPSYTLHVEQLKWTMNTEHSITTGRLCWDSNVMEQEAIAKIYEPRQKYYWTRSFLNFVNVYISYWCEANFDEYQMYLSKIPTLCDKFIA